MRAVLFNLADKLLIQANSCTMFLPRGNVSPLCSINLEK